MKNVNSDDGSIEVTRSLEWKSFLLITVVLFPVLSVALVGGYGFLIWMMQVLFMGPPGIHG
ncbi:trimethylamine N-oxide reductase system protein TorE [Vibrio hannami]|uniref:trimethylamine N-oxide reductase system protein TorE n=1 Tax=Vibrio hannami TaxID=2717094 RepID=UPI00241009DD|nr:trimethylamine N-oxide reductase system protein TorE [Vibrio hannami]MDG3088358.1 trimethylamine N-oxide reductase system protein TorE [Vibrio hannami]